MDFIIINFLFLPKLIIIMSQKNSGAELKSAEDRLGLISIAFFKKKNVLLNKWGFVAVKY